MRRLGIVARADRGGLAAQTLAVAQHLSVAAALVLDLGDAGRGPVDLKPWTKAVVKRGGRLIVAEARPHQPPNRHLVETFLEQCDVVYAAECPPLDDTFPQLCQDRGVEFFIHVNPELWKQHYRAATTRLILPTDWHADRFPDATVLPMPVDRKRFPYQQRESAHWFLHLSAPAMDDRAGTNLLAQAVHHVRTPTRLFTRGVTDKRHQQLVGNVEVTDNPPVADNRDLYPRGDGVAILPRRYGGLSLVFLEAASLGVPIITLDLPPQNGWMPPEQLVQTLPAPPMVGMIGGGEAVHDANPQALAERIDLFANEPELVARCSKQMDVWAEANSWARLVPLWRETLGL